MKWKEWKWSKGEKCERSQRNVGNNINTNLGEYSDENYPVEIEQSAYTSSLNHDENTWDMLNQAFVSNSFRQSNIREELDTKLSNRELVQQIGVNPFMQQSNYVEDITACDNFLKPQNTTVDRVKFNENSIN
jgi:hypothetical protein